jgi:hypothetical protein
MGEREEREREYVRVCMEQDVSRAGLPIDNASADANTLQLVLLSEAPYPEEACANLPSENGHVNSWDACHVPVSFPHCPCKEGNLTRQRSQCSIKRNLEDCV